jgi:tetratricopeptide (TPR) repeat protein
VVPADKYKPSYDSFANSLNLTLEFLITLKEDIENSKYTFLAYEQKINELIKQLDVSKTYRSKLFVLHYTDLSREIELISANLYESDEFEKSIYYLKLLLPIYEEQAETKRIADAYYHLGLAYRKVGITGKYDLIRDLQKEDHKLYFMKNIWLQIYCNSEAYYSVEKALSAYRQTQSRLEVATMLCILGSMNTFPLDDPEQAIEYYKEAAKLFSVTDSIKCAKILNAIGAVYYLKGRYLKLEEDERRRELNNIALSYYKQALTLVKKENDPKNSLLLFAINYNIELIETHSRGAPIKDTWY